MNYHLNVDLHNPMMNKILVKNYPQEYATTNITFDKQASELRFQIRTQKT